MPIGGDLMLMLSKGDARCLSGGDPQRGDNAAPASSSVQGTIKQASILDLNIREPLYSLLHLISFPVPPSVVRSLSFDFAPSLFHLPLPPFPPLGIAVPYPASLPSFVRSFVQATSPSRLPVPLSLVNVCHFNP